MDQSFASASVSETHVNAGDWSPRISFSHSFACIQRVPSPNKGSSLHDSEFEFSRSVGSDLLSAEELFCNGKLRPLKLSSHESCKREWKASPRRQELHIMAGKKGAPADCAGNAPASSKENPISGCGEDSISRWGRKPERNAGEAKSPTIREEPISVCRRAEKVETGKKPVGLTSPSRRKEDLPCVSGTVAAAEKHEDSKATTLRVHTSREGLNCACNLEKGRKACKSESPTSRKELISVRKPEMGDKAGKSRSPTSKEFMPAFKPERSSKAGKPESHTSNEIVMFACNRVENPELKGKAGQTKVPTSREDLLSTACSTSRKCEKGGMLVKWREEPRWATRNEEDEHANWHLRRFSKHPRSASMSVEGSGKHGNRSCVSLNNSRCPSPTRSFSLPATTPASPSAASSFSGFSSSSFSSSSRYRSKIKDFFKLKKLTVLKEETLSASGSSSSSTCRLPISPRSLLAFFKSKESSKTGSRSSSSMHEGPQQAQEHVCASTKDVYGGGANKDKFSKCKDLNPLSQSQNINKELAISGLTLPNIAKPPPPNPFFPFHFPPSSSTSSKASAAAVSTPQHSSTECAAGSKLRALKSHSFSHEKVLGIEGPPMLVIDEGIWEEGNFNRSNNNALNLHTNCSSKEGIQRVKKGNMMMVGSKGGPVRSKGLERPLPYTSSVRVTPVLNVPSCITPSLRKTKLSSSKHKVFGFENFFARRERAFITPTFKSSEA